MAQSAACATDSINSLADCCYRSPANGEQFFLAQGLPNGILWQKHLLFMAEIFASVAFSPRANNVGNVHKELLLFISSSISVEGTTG
jgi:hypothetical protein